MCPPTGTTDFGAGKRKRYCRSRRPNLLCGRTNGEHSYEESEHCTLLRFDKLPALARRHDPDAREPRADDPGPDDPAARVAPAAPAAGERARAARDGPGVGSPGASGSKLAAAPAGAGCWAAPAPAANPLLLRRLDTLRMTYVMR